MNYLILSALQQSIFQLSSDSADSHNVEWLCRRFTFLLKIVLDPLEITYLAIDLRQTWM